MSELNASLYHLQNTQSIAFKFLSDSVKSIERQIRSPAGLSSFTPEQMDLIVLICDQFEKLVKLRSESELIDDLLAENFPELSKPAEERQVLAAEPPRNGIIEPIDRGTENQVTFVCDDCDEIVDIVNGDLNYSTQLHLSSPIHQEVVSCHLEIKEFEAPATSLASLLKSTVLAAQNSPLVEPVPQNVSNRNELTKSKATQPVSKEEASFQRYEWIQSQGQNEYLQWYRSEYYCWLCDVYLSAQSNFDAHVKSFRHRTTVKEVETTARRTNMKSRSLHFLDFRYGKMWCSLCNFQLHTKAAEYLHFNGSKHTEQLGMVARIPRNQSHQSRIFRARIIKDT